MTEQANGVSENQPEFSIQRIYMKDLSFETPAAPGIFREQWQPEMKLDLQTTSAPLEEHFMEVTLHATVTVSSKNSTVFVVDVKYAGIFSMQGFSEKDKQAIINTVCPSILYPYLRERVTSVASDGTFPQLILAPVNFDALYAQQLKQQELQEKA